MAAPIRLALIRLALIVSLLLPILPAAAQETVRHLFYEAVPMGAGATAYERRQALTERTLAALLPDLLTAAKVPADAVRTEPRMGGYKLETNPALHSAARLSDAGADRLALALGWVLGQESVLVADLTRDSGRTGYVLIRFPEGSLTPDLAQRFFLAAAKEREGLGGGYTALGDRMLFLNLRGGDGRPYSGLSDAEFAAALRRVVAGFPGAVLDGRGSSAARLIESAAAPSALDPATLAALKPLRDRHEALTRAMLQPIPEKVAQ